MSGADKLSIGQHHNHLATTRTEAVLNYINKVQRCSLDELCEIFADNESQKARNQLHSLISKLCLSRRIRSIGTQEERRFHAVPVDSPQAPLAAPRTWSTLLAKTSYVPEPALALRPGAMDFARLPSVGDRC